MKASGTDILLYKKQALNRKLNHEARRKAALGGVSSLCGERGNKSVDDYL